MDKAPVHGESIKTVLIFLILFYRSKGKFFIMTGSSSFLAKPGQVERKWYVVDATDRSLGRLAAEISKILTGKNKPTYTPHVDTGDYVIVINAEKSKIDRTQGRAVDLALSHRTPGRLSCYKMGRLGRNKTGSFVPSRRQRNAS